MQQDLALASVIDKWGYIYDCTFTNEFSDALVFKPPAGLNTSASVSIQFERDGKVDILVEESEVTSESEDEDTDPYDQGLWRARYIGTIKGGFVDESVAGNAGGAEAVSEGHIAAFVINVNQDVCEFVGFDTQPPEHMPLDIECKLSHASPQAELSSKGTGSSPQVSSKLLIHLRLHFEAGACNDGRAGMKWVVLTKRKKKAEWPAP